MREAAGQLTFISFADLFDYFAKQCEGAALSLDSKIHGASPPFAPFDSAIAQVVDREKQLANMFADYVIKGPKTLLSTRIQYTLPKTYLRKPASTGHGIRQLERINREIEDELREQANKIAGQEAQQKLALIAQQINSMNREISKIRLSVRDI